MSSWIGMPGALAPIACPVREDAASERTISEMVPFSGQRVVQLGQRVRRSWSVGYGVENPRDFAVLDALTRWGSPLVWVGALAQATNLLTPDQATLRDAIYAGGAGARAGMLMVDGAPVVSWAGGPVGGQINVTGEKPVPVRPGVPVTVSIWGQRAGTETSARLSYWFRDATEAQVAASTISGSSSDALVRRSWTLTPPDGAATLSVVIRDAAVVAMPQVTWTPAAVDWSPGRGVHRVVVLPGTESPLIAHARQVLVNADYRILEVG